MTDMWEDVKPCAYCGMPADSLDHVIPQSLRKELEDIGGWRQTWPRVTDVVPCCRECNSLAGSLVFNTIAEKRDYIHQRLRTRHADLLKTAHWTQAELDDMGPTMRQYIMTSQNAAELLRERLRWPQRPIESDEE